MWEIYTHVRTYRRFTDRHRKFLWNFVELFFEFFLPPFHFLVFDATGGGWFFFRLRQNFNSGRQKVLRRNSSRFWGTSWIFAVDGRHWSSVSEKPNLKFEAGVRAKRDVRFCWKFSGMLRILFAITRRGVYLNEKILQETKKIKQNVPVPSFSYTGLETVCQYRNFNKSYSYLTKPTSCLREKSRKIFEKFGQLNRNLDSVRGVHFYPFGCRNLLILNIPADSVQSSRSSFSHETLFIYLSCQMPGCHVG